jgi:hypothetical protein
MYLHLAIQMRSFHDIAWSIRLLYPGRTFHYDTDIGHGAPRRTVSNEYVKHFRGAPTRSLNCSWRFARKTNCVPTSFSWSKRWARWFKKQAVYFRNAFPHLKGWNLLRETDFLMGQHSQQAQVSCVEKRKSSWHGVTERERDEEHSYFLLKNLWWLVTLLCVLPLWNRGALSHFSCRVWALLGISWSLPLPRFASSELFIVKKCKMWMHDNRQSCRVRYQRNECQYLARNWISSWCVSCHSLMVPILCI